MSTLDIISEASDAIGEAITLNYVFLLAISAVIYVVWTSLMHKALKSVWYISLGIPGTIALILFLADFLFFHAGPGIIERIKVVLLALVYLPGFIVPVAVLIYHALKFSSTEPMTRSAYLFAIPIGLTYVVNWIVFWYLVNA
ncbi:MAG TPA: hypothetical protein VKC66_12560 [Xanthobacteraceae bacterium]|nr:hypothetical protein [Xanthobacteraceae bacterium]